SQKRLAVRVEDHPLGYASFEGTIPEGQYGAGEVVIWDHGTYDNLLAEGPDAQTVGEGIEAGRLEFALHGRRLRGRFTLVRMPRGGRGKENWLLIKAKDQFARAGDAAKEPPAPAKVAERAKRAPAAKRSGRPGKLPELTHSDRVLYPGAGITKGEVF